MVSDVEHHFVYLLAICMSSLEICLIQFLCPFNRIVFCVIELYVLYILDVNPLSDIWFANIFSHSMGCLSV